jgi:hypothetical protein
MINTHIFLVILVTVVLILIAEYQNLRKISWILLIACVTYIVLMIEPKNIQSTYSEYAEYTYVDSSNIIEVIKYPIENDIIDEATVSASENNIIDEIQKLDLLSLAIATDIVERTPKGVSRLFLNDIDALYCFTAVDNTIKNNKIIHNWKYNEQDFYENIIVVGDSRYWRCWSRITIKPEMAGEWQVIVTDSIGSRLDSIYFSIIPTSE